MKRVFIISAIVLVLLIVGIGVFLYNSIDPIVKSAIEKYGSEITGTQVSVSSVDISLKSGRGTIRGIEVRNPKGFKAKNAFRLGEITIGIDIASLNKDPIVIDEVRIAAPEVSVEVNGSGQSNIAVIKNHVDGYHSDPATTRKQNAGYEKKFRIAQFTFEEGKVAADAGAVGVDAFDATLPPVRLRNVGGAAGSAPDRIGKDVTQAFIGAAMGTVTREIRKRATVEMKDGAEKALDKLLH